LPRSVLHSLRQRLGAFSDLLYRAADVRRPIDDLYFFLLAAGFAANLLRQFLQPLDLLYRLAVDRRFVLEINSQIFRDVRRFLSAIDVLLMVFFGHLDRTLRANLFFKTG